MIEIKSKKLCTGCSACANICPNHTIIMETDNEGFLYPKVDKENCVKCGLCEKVCHILHTSKLFNNPIAYAGYNKDERIRMESSSGGIFTLIAEHIIDKCGVVFGAAFDEHFNVEHIVVDNKKDLAKLRASKYVQSKIGYTYSQAKDFLEQNRLVLFTGTPCQVAGLKSYLGKDYDNLICQDVICHGVPSPIVWKKYMIFREKKASSPIKFISFRNKTKGWMNFSLFIMHENGSKYISTINKDMYLVGFNKNLYLRPSCYECYYKTEQRQADITLADFWGIQNLMPEINDDKGISLLLIHSSKGKIVLDKVKNKLVYKQVEFKSAIKYNPAMVNSMQTNKNRDKFYEELNAVDFDKLMKKYCTEKLSVRTKKKTKFLIKKVVRRIGLLIE
ncbi:Coenzyme F420 hydrogenase/dehydrogenase, beta subunit C-terminal domain [Clostridium sp. JS66]|uniref:Coenzyme F420 hydrogenase/dehydrogenase, beta subunit C-terminal domain n=1 Tax=Clostridium sp. JS66 TaxID=3064705 RepID=UPI00298E968E|nr:Coenzyme F420 hydrogenase/dehydrogenase, beta subunit C-terminal domain [Clostridium sp. JS66]WPC43290.1 Coenzyme F420 hydrogenase/dehydrogenase, beta subunit C-terminal domain [Clostridium sp. JS66]